MQANQPYQIIGLLLLVLGFFVACTEPYAFENESYEDILVVDGMLTNQIKKHQLYLARSYAFGQQSLPEKGAMVRVVDQEGNAVAYREKADFVYEATQPFGAQAGKEYHVEITTAAGKNYRSRTMRLPEVATIEGVTASAATNDLDEAGIRIAIDAQSASNDSRLYRLEYEETYKVVAPFWTPYDAVVVFEGYSTFETAVILRETEERVCYALNKSNKIMLRSTANQTLDRIDQEEVVFLSTQDAKLIHRYSVLVRLLVEQPETYNYFNTLKELSAQSVNFFSAVQPGYLTGNLFNPSNEAEKVAGFFRVSAADEARIFINLNDYYPDAEEPPYFRSCGFQAPLAEGTRGNRSLLNIIYRGWMRFYDYNRGEMPGGPYLMVPASCGDCTVLGSNKKPDFWIP